MSDELGPVRAGRFSPTEAENNQVGVKTVTSASAAHQEQTTPDLFLVDKKLR